MTDAMDSTLSDADATAVPTPGSTDTAAFAAFIAIPSPADITAPVRVIYAVTPPMHILTAAFTAFCMAEAMPDAMGFSPKAPTAFINI